MKRLTQLTEQSSQTAPVVAECITNNQKHFSFQYRDNMLNIGLTFLGKRGLSFHIEIRENRGFQKLQISDFENHGFWF